MNFMTDLSPHPVCSKSPRSEGGLASLIASGIEPENSE